MSEGDLPLQGRQGVFERLSDKPPADRRSPSSTKTMTEAKLRGARQRKKATSGKCEGRKRGRDQSGGVVAGVGRSRTGFGLARDRRAVGGGGVACGVGQALCAVGGGADAARGEAR